MPAVREYPRPTLRQLAKAQRLLEEQYGDPFYRVATELVVLAHKKQTRIRPSEALAALLLTWNKGYYRYHPELSRTLVPDLDALLAQHRRRLSWFRDASIESLSTEQEPAIRTIFGAFCELLGPVGAAKALHLLAPYFFPLWDTEIARAYGVGGGHADRKADRYLEFMWISQAQCEQLGGEKAVGRNPLKALDEFNFCRFTRGWL